MIRIKNYKIVLTLLLIVGLNQGIFLCFRSPATDNRPVSLKKKTPCACPPASCMCPPSRGCEHRHQHKVSDRNRNGNCIISGSRQLPSQPVLDSDIPILAGHLEIPASFSLSRFDRLTDITHLSPYLALPDKPPQVSAV